MALPKKKKPIAPWRQNILAHHKRSAPKRGDITRVTPNVRKEVNRRSMEMLGASVPVCERCGTTQNLTKAHIVNASQGGPGGDPANIINLCGTHGMKGTCHDWADNTKDGRKWKEQYGKMLRKYYKAA